MRSASAASRWSLPALGFVFLSASIFLPERFDQGTSIENRVEVLDLGVHCAEARRLFDFASEFAATHRGCSTSADCRVVRHPIGCPTVVSEAHVEAFDLIKARIAERQAAAFGACSLSRARCARSHAPVCAQGECTIRERPRAWTPEDDG